MKKVRFKKIDAFAARGSGGNPAGAVYLGHGDELSGVEMQRIATELKGFVSEVGYVNEIEDGTFGLKYFSAEKEVEFCGHATIAIMYDVISGDRRLVDREAVEVVTNGGRLVVENRLAREDAVFVTAPEPAFADTIVGRDEAAQALGTSPDSVGGPVAIVNAGLETLIVPIESLDAVLALHPSTETLRAFCEEKGVDICLVFSKVVAYRANTVVAHRASTGVADKANSYRTRVFAPVYGYLEDPATGSGSAAFGHYLLRNGMWDGSAMSLEQNGDALRPNRVSLMARMDGAGKARVLFGGGAVVRFAGEYFLP